MKILLTGGAGFIGSHLLERLLARGDDVAVTTLFLLEGRVPTRVRWLLYGSLAVNLAITVATAAAKFFATISPTFG